MVALETHHVAEGDLPVGLDIQRHTMAQVLARDIIPVFVHAFADLVEHGPHAQVTDTGCAEIDGGIGGGEVELVVLAVEIALATCEVDDVVFVDDFHLFIIEFLPVFVGDGGLPVAEFEGGDPGGVGVTADIAVGDAYRHPHGAPVGVDGVAGLRDLWRIALGHDLHVPDLIGVADAERLAVTAVAIFINQVGHHLDGFTCRSATFQGDEHQAAVIDDARGIHQFLAASEGGLT